MRLSKATLDEGRRLLRAGDLDGFMAWNESLPMVSRPSADVTRATFGKWMDRDMDAALRIFESIYPLADPVLDAARALTRLALAAFSATGLLGGVVYLLRTCVVAQ